LSLSGCASFSSDPLRGPSIPNPEAAADEALGRTLPESPVQIVFGFKVREAEARYDGGRGVARMEPPYKVRIDLFSHQGETLFSGALVGGGLLGSWSRRLLFSGPL
jgi:hypothetical protein